MRDAFRFGVALALGLALMAGCSDENGEGGNGGMAGTAGTAGAGGMAGTAGAGGSAEYCDDGTQAAYDSAICEACVMCAIEGPCQQCNAKSCQDFLGCALSCTSVECTARCIDRYPTGAALFWESYLCAVCDACPNNCGFPAPPMACDSGVMTCFQDDECTDSLICCHTGGPFTLGVCLTQAVCDELQGGI